MKILTFLALLLLLISSGYAANSPLPTPVARVVWIKGDGLNATMLNKEVRLLQKESVVYLNDQLTTNANTSAEIVFTDNTLMTFQPDTKFSIDKYNYSGGQKKNTSVGKSVMRLIEGGFRTITGLIAKSNPSDYQVQTPIATIGVRGTDYAVYLKGGQLFAAYYTGSPCITSNNNPNVLCLSQTTQYAQVSSASLPPQPLTQQPEGFKQKLEITNVKIGLFTRPGGNGKGGPMTSFCIQ
jgi:FecR protein